MYKSHFLSTKIVWFCPFIGIKIDFFMILIFSVHFWDIHISPQLRVQRAWQRLLGARAGVQDCSREGKANEARKGYNQTHNCLKLHSYFCLCPKLPDVLSYNKSQLKCFHLHHTTSHILSVGISTVCTTYICWSQLCSKNKRNTLHHKKRKLFVKPLVFVDRAYPHDLINILIYKDVKSFCRR